MAAQTVEIQGVILGLSWEVENAKHQQWSAKVNQNILGKYLVMSEKVKVEENE